jgi:transposase InsO family protein
VTCKLADFEPACPPPGSAGAPCRVSLFTPNTWRLSHSNCARIAAVHADSGRAYGRPRVHRALRDSGVRVGHERVRRSLRRQGLASVHRKPYRVTTDSAHAHPIAPNRLDRRFDGRAPDRAWVADITCAPTAEGWRYLACVLDLGTQAAVGWSMSDRIGLRPSPWVTTAAVAWRISQ